MIYETESLPVLISDCASADPGRELAERWGGAKDQSSQDSSIIRQNPYSKWTSQICDLLGVRLYFYLRLCPVSEFANYFHESHDNFTGIQIMPLTF